MSQLALKDGMRNQQLIHNVLRSQEVLLVNLQDGKVVQQYHGCDSGSFITQSCFGGVADNYILRGGGGEQQRHRASSWMSIRR